MKLEINASKEELDLLTRHLGQHLQQLDRDLVRTDKAELQHALAREVETLESLVNRLRLAAS